ncbi:MAG: hypothetical protein R8L58_02025 [Mariprofundaceae bacterium]
MRKWTACSIIWTLLAITSMPMLAMAACDMPGMQASTMMSMADDDIDCFIECGCKLGSHLDSLPHQLAPHALDNTTRPCVISSMALTPAGESPVAGIMLRIPVPPPEA